MQGKSAQFLEKMKPGSTGIKKRKPTRTEIMHAGMKALGLLAGATPAGRAMKAAKGIAKKRRRAKYPKG